MRDLSAWPSALADALVQCLWQGALLGLLAAAILALLRNARPQARYTVACLALAACVLWPALTLAGRLLGRHPDLVAPAPEVVAMAASLAQATGLQLAMPSPLSSLSSAAGQSWILPLWAGGVLLLALRMAAGLWWVRGLCASAVPGPRWQACVDGLVVRMGIPREVALRLGDGDEGPLTAGWWRPVILLPAAVAARMPADLVEALLAHELAHIRRHDYLVNLLQGLVETLLFYHPAVWWLSRRIRIERELVADRIAAEALGEPRRLAMALSGLDQLLASPPPVHFAPAAHGGQLMSRIRQLVRPERRSLGGAVLLPLLGLAVAGASLYAHARLAPVAAPSSPPGAPPQALAADVRIAGDGDAYALVRAGDGGVTMSGSSDDAGEIEAVRARIDRDFLWFRRDGQAWVVRDADTLRKAREAWAPAEALGRQMEGLSARMRPYNARMEALSGRVQSLLAGDDPQSPEARAAYAQLESLDGRMRELDRGHALLADRSRAARGAERGRLLDEQQALAREQATLSAQMERQADVLAAEGERQRARHAPMQALSRQMEDEGESMAAIGRQMEAQGARIEQASSAADAKTRALIDAAYASGRAQRAATLQ